jgi:hypothetical protein
MVWHAGDGSEALSVVAQPEEGGTTIAIQIDRRGTMALTAVTTLIVSITATISGMDQAWPPAIT